MTQLTTHTEQPLYPKISPIYNKIMQLAIAIFLIIVLMNLWVFSYGNNQQSTTKHFNQISQQYLMQITSATQIFLQSDDANERKNIQHYFDDIAKAPWIKELSFYDKTGMLLIASQEYSTINDLYGISSNKADRSDKYSTFIREVSVQEGSDHASDDQNVNISTLEGYIRFTVANHSLTKEIEAQAAEHYDLVRLMMILAVVVGFFLTRGLNRFSRQGFRLR
ncbi:AhpA/YtjB family protein [Colwellia sp. 1_MG-2023]|uniref:AhpA/YtjB family protein n=1 Tax=Colwellia sp. 1_MG-2023 TaxID=3062649 RepID=UPI0026E350CE|nr:AhpA/YtjB family protein [Colwellia sp. 1_MG-2023]MDO6446318.1 AhpA/YtjB family protein [Colwellia sp. 1_MG-2023]